MSGTLSGKRVLVIGASAGIGRALAVRAVQEGAQVLMAARRGAELEKAAAEARGGQPVTVDVRVPEDCARLATAARETLGQIDILAFTVGAATLSMMAKVNRYCQSVTANEYRGGTNRKSNASTPSTELNAPAPRPPYIATSALLSRYTITRLA